MNLELETSKSYYRRYFIILVDFLSSILATFLSIILFKNSNLLEINLDSISLYFLSIIIYIPVFIYFNIYKYIIRYTNIETIITITKAIVIYSFFYILVIINFYQEEKLSLFFIQIIIFYSIIVVIRLFFYNYLKFKPQNSKNRNILIYGAGVAGINFAETLIKNSKFNLIAYVDDDLSKQNRSISNIPVISFDKINNYKFKYFIDEIILAIPSLSISKRREIINNLSKLNVKIKTLPDLSDYIENKKFFINDLSLNDLIDRNIKSSSNDKKIYKNKNILITGGGGSIGSELSRQILNYEPDNLIIFDHSEYNLYKIMTELKTIKDYKKLITNIHIILGSIKDFKKLETVFIESKPDIIFHAAAYKHVNIVEKNIVEAVDNNIIGTFNLIQLSNKYHIENFLLVSTDKAVRPTNFMGATKRISEMIVQSASKEAKPKKNYSIVRFGNVLGSSGSVIPLFNKQIKNLEPLTVTHPEVKRYIMTVPEAVNLILQSVEISTGGEIFLLDMGEPVKIIELARKLINLSGLTEKNKLNPNGDIEIKIIGLRPGEKLLEELLIDSNAYKTSNENIFIADEDYLNFEELNSLIEN